MKDVSNKLVYVVLGVLLLSAFKSSGPEKPPADVPYEEPRTLRVTGSADMLVPLDEISVDISYREYWYTYNKTKHDIGKIEKKIV